MHDEWINRPSTIYVDREGIVRFAYYGANCGDRPTIEETLEMIETDTFDFVHPERGEPQKVSLRFAQPSVLYKRYSKKEAKQCFKTAREFLSA